MSEDKDAATSAAEDGFDAIQDAAEHLREGVQEALDRFSAATGGNCSVEVSVDFIDTTTIGHRRRKLVPVACVGDIRIDPL